MQQSLSHSFRVSFAIVAAAGLFAACSEQAGLAPEEQSVMTSAYAAVPDAETNRVLATLRRVTARYHDLDVAFADGFVLLHPCENRPGEGPVGTVYVHVGRLMDGAITPELPDALIYEPSKTGRETLVGVEFAIPYGLWTAQTPPTFLGAEFQPEDEFGVWALHAWVWRYNSEGMFAESNPSVSCLAE